MHLEYSHLGKRILSVLVGVPVVTTAVYRGPLSYFLLFLVIAALAMLEFYQLASSGGISPNKLVGIGGGILTYTLVFMHISGHMSYNYLYLLCPLITIIYLTELYQKSASPLANIAYTLLGIVYVSGPFTLLHITAFPQGSYSHEVVMGILLILWANDTGAYLVGSSMGKHSLLKRISPNKSWEGAFGGGILALVTSYTVANYFSSMGAATWLGIGGIVGVAGTYGDLVESMLKRSLKVKDSGKAIPGHGGFLDRFDSFLLAIPFIVAFIKILH